MRRRERGPRIHDELAYHRDALVEKYLADGLDRDAAERRAVLELGNPAVIEEEVKDARGRWLLDLGSDLRYAVHTALRQPGFTTGVVLALTLGIGSCVAVFAIVHAVLLRPLPFPSPDSLCILWMTNPRQGFDRDVISYPQFRDWREKSDDVFEALAVHSPEFASLADTAGAQEIRLSEVSEQFFAVLGRAPALGQTFPLDEFGSTTPGVAVLAHSLWSTRFGSDQKIIGRTIALDGKPVRVVGVMPEDAAFPRGTEAWVPLAPSPVFENRGIMWLNVVARLRPETTPQQAQRRMDAIAAEINAAHPNANPGSGVIVSPMHQDLQGATAPSLWLLQGAVLLVLLIACGNVSNLLLARSMTRRHEFATRLALGASFLRVSRQVLTEVLVLALAGAFLGVVLALGMIRMLPAFLQAGWPAGSDGSVLLPVVGAALILAMSTALVVCLAPLVSIRRISLHAAIKDGGRGQSDSGGTSRLRSMLVAGQVALALILLVGASLLIRSFISILDLGSGYTTDAVLTARISLPATRYSPEQRVAAWTDLLRQVRELADVRSAGAVSTVMLETLPESAPLTGGGRVGLPAAVRALPIAIDSATAGYFDAVGQRVISGRDISEIDQVQESPVAVVNESFARTFLNADNAVGERITFGDPQNPAEWLTIVGIVSDVRRGAGGPDAGPRPELYVPYALRPSVTMVLAVRGSGDSMTMATRIGSILRAMDPNVPLARLQSLQDLLGARLDRRRFLMRLLAAFAVSALGLAAFGIYGVVNYTVTRRLPDFSVRLALGATPGTIRKAVIWDGLRAGTLGVGIGLIGAALLSNSLRSQLYAVSPHDPLIFSSVVALVLGVTMFASWLPALRASRGNPMLMLRRE